MLRTFPYTVIFAYVLLFFIFYFSYVSFNYSQSHIYFITFHFFYSCCVILMIIDWLFCLWDFIVFLLWFNYLYNGLSNPTNTMLKMSFHQYIYNYQPYLKFSPFLLAFFVCVHISGFILETTFFKRIKEWYFFKQIF